MNSVPTPTSLRTLDGAMVILHDAIRNRQTESGALTDRFGGEERVENLAANGFRDSGAGVANRDCEEDPSVWLVVTTIWPWPTTASTAFAIKFISTWLRRPA